MTLGGNKRNVYLVIVLGLLAAYSVYTNLLSGQKARRLSSSQVHLQGPYCVLSFRRPCRT